MSEVLVLVLVLEAKVLVLVLVLDSQVLVLVLVLDSEFFKVLVLVLVLDPQVLVLVLVLVTEVLVNITGGWVTWVLGLALRIIHFDISLIPPKIFAEGGANREKFDLHFRHWSRLKRFIVERQSYV